MKRLNEKLLTRGDIVLTTSTAAVSKAIRAATGSDVSHAMVYVEDRSIIDATQEGVQARNTQRLFFEDETSIYVLRVHAGPSDTQLSTVETFLRGHVGTRYSKKEAIRTVLGGKHQWSEKQFCSRLVAQAFASAGIHLVDDPNFCSPGDIKESALLTPVSDASLAATAEEMAFFDDALDLTLLMRNAINAVLDGARRRDNQIETFDDIHRHLMSHPEDDNDFCELLATSGYLSVWQIEAERHRWQYDVELMNGVAGLEEYCWSVLENENVQPHRYTVNRGGYLLFSRQFDLRFFRLMLELYDHLATQHRKRLDTAAEWLERGGFLTTSDSYLIPHTAEWFAALEQWDPPKAIMTRTVIEIAGNSDVCSVCGDTPASDYRLEKSNRPPDGPDTLRLCEDCLGIRKMHGELFAPLMDNPHG